MDDPVGPILRPPAPSDEAAMDALYLAAFGPGRFAKTSERIREGLPYAPELSVAAFDDDRVVGATRQSRMRVGERVGVFLGPFAVADDRRGERIGPRMIHAAVQAASAAGLDFVLLIGPQAYFAPLGFAPLPRGTVATPGAVDPARLLIRMLADAPPPSGAVGPPS